MRNIGVENAGNILTGEGQLIHHWHITGDDSSNEIVSQALQFQVGDNKDYNPKNWSLQLVRDIARFTRMWTHRRPG